MLAADVRRLRTGLLLLSIPIIRSSVNREGRIVRLCSTDSTQILRKFMVSGHTRPPAFGVSGATATSSLARSACEPYRKWIEAQMPEANAEAIY